MNEVQGDEEKNKIETLGKYVNFRKIRKEIICKKFLDIMIINAILK